VTPVPPGEAGIPSAGARDGLTVRTVAAADRAPDLKGTWVPTVVNIEDDPVNRLLVERVLARRPHVVLRAAATGEEGLASIAEHRPDLVLLDLDLPDMHGTDVLRRLGEQAGPRPRVVVITADATAEQVSQVLAFDVAQYLTKPFAVADLLAVIDELPRHSVGDVEDGDPAPAPA
jgi:DNA-binding response OmpR family regulator